MKILTKTEALELLQKRYPKQTKNLTTNDIDLDCVDTITVWNKNGSKDFFNRDNCDFIGRKEY